MKPFADSFMQIYVTVRQASSEAEALMFFPVTQNVFLFHPPFKTKTNPVLY